MNELLKFELSEIPSNIILTIGIGEEGANAVNYMKKKEISGVDYLLLSNGIAEKELVKYRLVFILMGTGDRNDIGVAMVIAAMTKILNILTIGIVAIPFVKGNQVMNQFLAEIDSLKDTLDLLIIIPDDQRKSLSNKLDISPIYGKDLQIKMLAVQTISDLTNFTGYISTDFADVYSATRNSRFGTITTGGASGENKTMNALKKALSSSLMTLENIRKSKNILLYIVSGLDDVTLAELGDTIDYFQKTVHSDGEILWNFGLDSDIGDKVRITIIGTGLDKPPVFDWSLIPKR